MATAAADPDASTGAIAVVTEVVMTETQPLNSPDVDTSSPTVSDARPATPAGGGKLGVEEDQSRGKVSTVRFEDSTPDSRTAGRMSVEDGGRMSTPHGRVSAYPGRVEEPPKQRKTILQTLRGCVSETKFYHSETAQKMRNCLHGKTFVGLMSLALLIALFLPEIWVMAGVNSNIEMDIVLTIVMALFAFELVGLSSIDASYFLSFFFFMDILGTISMIFDISFMVGVDNTHPKTVTGSDDNAQKNLMLLRAARAARVGARAGRLSRVLRLLRFLPFLSAGKDEKNVGISASISRQLANLLATRVAALTILLVMAIPAFDLLTFPQSDHSLQTWAERLSVDRAEDTVLGNQAFAEEVNEMVEFYAKRSYGPYMACSGRPVGDDDFVCDKEFPANFKKKKPSRGASALKVHTSTFAVGFNMHQPETLEKGLAIVNIFFIIGIMIFSGLALSNVVTEIAVRPLERMLNTVREIAEKVFNFSKDMVPEEETEDEEFDVNSSTEMKLLEKVVAKLAIVADLQSGQNAPQIEEDMDEQDIGIINMMQGKDVVHDMKKNEVRRMSLGQSVKKEKQGPVVNIEDAGVTQESYNSFSFNTLTLTTEQMCTLGVYVISRFHDDGEGFVHTEEDKAILTRFMAAASEEYPKNPFHNFSHATDVLHGVARMMRLVKSHIFLAELEQFALLVAAVGHDIGHPGVNNPFLLEVGHDLAIQYNDNSPLENMHVAKLYGIVQNQENNVFASLTKDQYKEVRKYCIETILHTDMIGHNQMVKDLNLLFCEGDEVFTRSRDEDDIGDMVELLSQAKNKMLVMDNILHSADVSNPCREWKVSQAWAMCVLEEFFSQGDQEKMLGVPVGFLNNRDTLNRPNSQIGFLEFMIAPFFAAQIKLFHNLHGYGDNLSINLANWEDMWAKEVQPDEEARNKVKARVEKVQTNLEEAKKSSCPTTDANGTANSGP